MFQRQQTYPTSQNKVQFADDNNPNSPLLKDNNESKSLELPSSNGILHSVESVSLCDQNILVPISLLDNAPNYLSSWVHYQKENHH